MLRRPIFRGYLLMLLAAAWLLIYPSIHQRSAFLQQHFRTYSYLFMARVAPAAADSVQTQVSLPDSMVLDSVKMDSLLAAPPPPAEAIPTEIPPLVGDYNGLNQLDSFFLELQQNKGQTRIAYYGDSSIEGDLMCMTFRDSMQQRFGGNGVGFVPIMSEIPGFRRSVRHSFSNNWYRNVIGESNDRKLLRGISGEYFVADQAPPITDSMAVDSLLTEEPASDEYWVRYRGSRWFTGTRTFDQSRLFYGRPQADSTGRAYGSVYSYANGQSNTHTLSAPELVNEVVLTDSVADRVRLQFDMYGTYPLYGVSLESEQGIIVDNFPCRGNSGRALLGISSSVMKHFQEKLDYDLIILQYGLNVINARVQGYDWYERQLISVIERFQRTMPGVPILLIGVPDKGTKLNGQMQTDPSVPRVTNVQRRAARQTGITFFSLYEAMGGPGSMVSWVEDERPRLANYDYTHFNFKGANVASDLLLDFLMNGYEYYRRNPEGLEL
jgi:lysophospholipase L1-like esterase